MALITKLAKISWVARVLALFGFGLVAQPVSSPQPAPQVAESVYEAPEATIHWDLAQTPEALPFESTERILEPSEAILVSPAEQEQQVQAVLVSGGGRYMAVRVGMGI